MSTNEIGIYLPPEVWTKPWSANTKLVFGYLLKCQGKNGCAWPFQTTMVELLKKPNRRTIQTSIAQLEAYGHLRKLKAESRSGFAYQVRTSTADEWPPITAYAAQKAQISPGQVVNHCAASGSKVEHTSSPKLGRKYTQGNRPTSDVTYIDNIDDLFDDDDDLDGFGSEGVSSPSSSGQPMTPRFKNGGAQ